MAELWSFVWLMAKEKDFFLIFIGSCQGDFCREAEELHDLDHNFAVNNIVVELFWFSEGFFTMAVCSWGLCESQYIGF